MKIFLSLARALLLSLIVSAFGGLAQAQTCNSNVDSFGAVGNGSTNDATAIQNAINHMTAGQTLCFSAGKNYSLGSQWVTLKPGVRYIGLGSFSVNKTLNATTRQIDSFSGSYAKISGDANSGASFTLGGPTPTTTISNLFFNSVRIRMYDMGDQVNITGNVFDNFTGTGDGQAPSGGDVVILENGGYTANSHIDNNVFRNIWNGAISAPGVAHACQWVDNWSTAYPCSYGIFLAGFINTSVKGNIFQTVEGDAFNAQDLYSSQGQDITGNVVTDNEFIDMNRMGVEIQQQRGNRFAGLDFERNLFHTNHTNAAYVFGYSLPLGCLGSPYCGQQASIPTNIQQNNTVIFNRAGGGGLANAYEMWGQNIDARAEFVLATPTTNGGNPIVNYANTAKVQNIWECGPLGPYGISTGGNQYGTAVIQYNYGTSTCQAAGDGRWFDSHAQLSITNLSPNQTLSGTVQVKAAVTSQLSINSLSLKVDSTTQAPVATVRQSDINTNFSNDGKLLYTALLNVGGLSAGSHTLYVVATDITGHTVTATLPFSVGGSGSSCPIANGTYVISNQLSGLVIDDFNWDTFPRQMDQWTTSATRDKNQLFVLTANGSCQYTMRNANSGLYLQDHPVSGQGNQLWQQTADNKSDELWTLTPLGNGYFTITNVATGFVMDDTGQSTAPGNWLITYPANAGTNQAWKFQ